MGNLIVVNPKEGTSLRSFQNQEFKKHITLNGIMKLYPKMRIPFHLKELGINTFSKLERENRLINKKASLLSSDNRKRIKIALSVIASKVKEQKL